MRLWYLTSLITMVMLFLLNIATAPILQHTVKHQAPIHKTLYIDRNLSEEELCIITGAALEWDLATNGLVSYDVVRLPHQNIDIDNSIIMVVVSVDSPEIIALDTATQGVHLGYFTEDSPIPYIALVPERIESNAYKTVVMHELGHSLGLKHNTGIEGVGTLMYPSIDMGANKITDVDLKNFCLIYGCDASQLHDQ